MHFKTVRRSAGVFICIFNVLLTYCEEKFTRALLGGVISTTLILKMSITNVESFRFLPPGQEEL